MARASSGRHNRLFTIKQKNMLRAIIFLCVVSIIACKPSGSSDPKIAKSTQDSIMGASDTARTIVFEDTTQSNRASIADLAGMVGKKVSEVGLWDKYGIGSRIEAFMGKDKYSTLRKDWNEETPLAKDGQVMYATGCRAGTCKDSKYILVFDLKQNGINVYHFSGADLRSFEEDKTIIGMPYLMQDWYDKVRSEQRKS
jgi:hypothetical protein